VTPSGSSRRWCSIEPQADLDWLIEITSVLAAAETYLLVTRVRGWDLDTYQGWLTTTMTRLLSATS